MNQLSRILGDDHNRCDDLFATAERAVDEQHWDDADRHFADFRTALSRHFAAEEDILFPAFETRSGMYSSPTQVMRAEHGQMNELVARMSEALSRRDTEAYLGEAQTLLILMRQHNLKEEQILYPLCDRALGNETDLMTALRRVIHPGT